jgi:hypothetical protein
VVKYTHTTTFALNVQTMFFGCCYYQNDDKKNVVVKVILTAISKLNS